MKDVEFDAGRCSFHDEKGAILGSIGAINGWNICPELHSSSFIEGGTVLKSHRPTRHMSVSGTKQTTTNFVRDDAGRLRSPRERLIAYRGERVTGPPNCRTENFAPRCR